LLLSRDQCQAYRDDGFVFLETVFSEVECMILAREAGSLTAAEREERILEMDGASVRSVYNLHKDSEVFGALVSDARLLGPARQLLGDELYVHQTQLNPKAAFVGENWEWHQDYFYWRRDDGMAQPHATNVVLYLDAMTVFNGPLFLIPRSHLRDYDEDTRTVADGWESTLSRDLKHVLSRAAIAESVEDYGIVAPLGPVGSVLIFDPRVLHASPSNISPHERTALFIRYNSIDNALRPMSQRRPAWVAERDPQPLQVRDRSFCESP
jgi:ectoine hydroxylase